MRSAVCLFDVCDRSFWHWTTMPVGRWVILTAESVLFTCCPRPRSSGRCRSAGRPRRSRSERRRRERRDDHLREGRVPTMRGVERRESHEAVDSPLGLQRPVGVLAADGDGGRLEPGFLARARLREPRSRTRGRPSSGGTCGGACRPSPARPSPRYPRHLEDRVARVVLAREERVLFEPTEFLLERADALGDLALVLTQREQFPRVLVLALQSLVAFELSG